MNLRLKNGRLSAYALSCGYVEEHYSHNQYVRLYREHGVYFCTVWKLSEGNTRTVVASGRILKPVRKTFDRMRKSA